MSNKQPEAGPGKKICPYCQREFRSKRGLAAHIRKCPERPEEEEEGEEDKLEAKGEIKKKTEGGQVDGVKDAISTAIKDGLGLVKREIESQREELLHEMRQKTSREQDLEEDTEAQERREKKEGEESREVAKKEKQPEVKVEESEGPGEEEGMEEVEEPSQGSEQVVPLNEVESRLEYYENSISSIQERVEGVTAVVATVREDNQDIMSKLDDYVTEEVLDSQIGKRLENIESDISHLKRNLREFIETEAYFDLSKIPPPILKSVYEVTLNEIVHNIIVNLGARGAEDAINNVLEEVRIRTTGSELFRFDGKKIIAKDLVNAIESGYLTVKLIHMTYKEIVGKLIEYVPAFKLKDFNNIIRMKSQEYAIERATRLSYQMRDTSKEINVLGDKISQLMDQFEETGKAMTMLSNELQEIKENQHSRNSSMSSRIERLETTLQQMGYGEAETAEEELGEGAEDAGEVREDTEAPAEPEAETAEEGDFGAGVIELTDEGDDESEHMEPEEGVLETESMEGVLELGPETGQEEERGPGLDELKAAVLDMLEKEGEMSTTKLKKALKKEDMEAETIKQAFDNAVSELEGEERIEVEKRGRGSYFSVVGDKDIEDEKEEEGTEIEFYEEILAALEDEEWISKTKLQKALKTAGVESAAIRDEFDDTIAKLLENENVEMKKKGRGTYYSKTKKKEV